MSTMPGARLSHGRLVLVFGIARLEFPLVDVTLEGPADVELVSEDCCRVRSGRNFAEVHAGGEGFVVATPTATLTDRGTLFGVNVSPAGASDIKVIQGLVDARHLATGKVVSVTTNSALRLSAANVETLGEQSEFRRTELEPRPVDESLRSIQISIAVGNGRDTEYDLRSLWHHR